MTSAIGTNPAISVKRGQQRAFTLIELILVMAMLVTVIGMAAPSLSRFFRGRTIESEARRLLALTRYGQSRAVSEGIPMVLWIDRSAGTYGLRKQNGFDFGPAQSKSRSEESYGGGQAKTYQLASGLSFDLAAGAAAKNQSATMRFAPDGSIDDDSMPMVTLLQDPNERITILLSQNRLKYEISPNGRPQ